MFSQSDCDCDCNIEICEAIIGNAVDVDLKKGDCEVRVDIKVGKKHCIRVWGQVKDCEGNPVNEALVKLLKPCYYHGKVEYEGIAHTTTDCLGFYQFDVCMTEGHSKYRILVGKANTGKEKVIHIKGLCDPCNEKT